VPGCAARKLLGSPAVGEEAAHLKQGSAETDQEVVDVVARLQALQKRKLAELPGHVRIQKAEAFVLLSKGKLDKPRGRTAAAAKQLEEARKAEKESEEKFKQATVDRDSLFADLGRVAQGPVPPDPGLDSMPEGDFLAEGTTKEVFIQMAAQFQQIHAKLLERKQQRSKQQVIDLEASQGRPMDESSGRDVHRPPHDLPPTQSVVITVEEALVWAAGVPVAGTTDDEISANRRIVADMYLTNDLKRRKVV
jgi:hypothetical protein